MTTKTKTEAGALDQLAELKRQAHEANQRVATADAERRSSARWLPAAQTRLAEYLTAGKRDPKTERELRDNVQDLEAMRIEVDRRGDHIIYADRRKVIEHEDARLAADDAVNAINHFLVEHRAEIEDEMRDRALADRDRLLTAIEELSSAAGAWSATARDWRLFLEQWGNDPSPAEIPGSPLGTGLADVELIAAQVRGGAKDPRGLTPMPVRLHPDSEDPDEVIYPGSLRGWAHVPRVISSAGGLGA